ncbi:MAG: response regulator [Anaerolineae bacterium]|nr:response regulator [Anaerolineae bacterium]
MDPLPDLRELLRSALNQLYDPVFLHRSPLVPLFGLADKSDPAQALQSLLTAGIRALKPVKTTPDGCKSRRYYQVLYYRYVQQYTQSDVARKVGLSPRHLRREQEAAIRALADHLAAKLGLGNNAQEIHARIEGLLRQGDSLEHELAQIGDSLTDRSTDVAEVLEEAVRLTLGLAQQHGVDLRLNAATHMPLAAAPRTVFKSIVLDLLTDAIQSVPDGSVQIEVTSDRMSVNIELWAAPSQEGQNTSPQWNQSDLAVPQELAALFRGDLQIDGEGQLLRARITFPCVGQIAVLAIEDNVDTLQLWKRYLQGSPYCLVGTSDPSEALEKAQELRPRIIILDVMMPGIDGWELLGQLRYHPTTRDIPVIVCTVHPQRELAFSLGASDFVRKPTTRQAFLESLERQSAAAPQT